MYFSSLIFMFIFLPAVLLLYCLTPRKLKNTLLLIANLVFYAWGEPRFVAVMLLSIISNYIFGILIQKHRKNERLAKAFVLLSVMVSIGLLGVFKYAGFMCDLLRQIAVFNTLPKISIPLPIGISFYTFQTLSYVIDVYRRDVKAQRNFIDFATYVSFFPQLIAGPIVRYRDIETQLKSRRVNVDKFGSGVRRFCVGLAKKLLIANQMGAMWDTMRTYGNELGVLGAWLGIIAFALQIYFDFSGYSDMAIGLGRMFGFEFCENFNYPYIAKSISDFWRRWHISLSSWFRDYVYIPLGGNRCKAFRHVFNLLIVWALTGLWHGASLNFLIWGLYYFVILVLEKYVYGKLLDKLPSVFGHVYSIFLILIGWTIFAFTDSSEMLSYLGYMFSGSLIGHDALSTALSYLPLMLIGILAALPVWRSLYRRVSQNPFSALPELVFTAVLLVLCTASLVSDGYNPFLYFRF